MKYRKQSKLLQNVLLKRKRKKTMQYILPIGSQHVELHTFGVSFIFLPQWLWSFLKIYFISFSHLATEFQ